MERSDWLAASSFERTRDLVSAINTISIHAKLRSVGAGIAVVEEDVRPAREHLLAFLEGLEGLLEDARVHKETAILGADPRVGELALRFAAEQRRVPHTSKLYEMSLDQIRELVVSENPADLPTLIAALEDLRTLVEQHSRADVVGILGDV